MTRLDQAIASTRAHLLSLRNAAGHWEGELSSSALSTATAIVALQLVDAAANASFLQAGARWLVRHQNNDGGWGDTTISKSNLSTTLLVWSALGLIAPAETEALARCDKWIKAVVGSLAPDDIARAVIARYGKDKTFSVPILMLATLCGRLGADAWKRVLPLPFELAALPRTWFGAIGLPVVSYALPALIAIGHARFHHAPPPAWSPLHWLRKWAWPRVRPMLASLQPSSGGYLEATPLTSFVTMALAGAGETSHPCVAPAVAFLHRSMRADGSWPIDTNLATWGTTLSIKALDEDLSRDDKHRLKRWLLDQQYKTVHPFTNAAPGGWAWTDLPGGVPDADDTSGALIALWHVCENDDERRAAADAANAGVQWLLDLQNRDGGMPTFCRGWGALPFDRSTPEITAHAIWAISRWFEWLRPELKSRWSPGQASLAQDYLEDESDAGHTWSPLWFGNEHTADESNRVYGTAQVIIATSHGGGRGLKAFFKPSIDRLLQLQHGNGSWGGSSDADGSVEETALVLQALAVSSETDHRAFQRGLQWLLDATADGTHFPVAPIGLYFARLWYHEKLYPVIWTLGALKAARAALETTKPG